MAEGLRFTRAGPFDDLRLVAATRPGTRATFAGIAGRDGNGHQRKQESKPVNNPFHERSPLSIDYSFPDFGQSVTAIATISWSDEVVMTFGAP